MSRKIKISDDSRVVARNEILQVADIVARDKGLDKEEILGAMEFAILKTAQTKYGTSDRISAHIDRKTGDITITKLLTVVETVVDPNNEISLKDAQKIDVEATIGDEVEDRLPPIDFGRIAAGSARQIINQRIKAAEHAQQYKEFESRIGEIVTGTIKRLEFNETILEVGRAEGVLRKYDVIPNENFRIGERIKVLITGLNNDSSIPLLQLSRTSPDFLKMLFRQEVPEVYDGVIKIMAAARDPGSKAKIAVVSSDPSLDPVGACVGIKGARVQAITEELKGEKIDIIRWNDNPAIFIANSISPASAIRIVMEEVGDNITVVVPDEQLSSAIGRRGQNIRLASKLTGYTINVINNSQDVAERQQENDRIVKTLREALDVDEMMAIILKDEGFDNIEDIALADKAEIASIEGFDDEIAAEIISRANGYIDSKKAYIKKLCEENKVEKDLVGYKLLRLDLLEAIVKAGIKSLTELGDLAADELKELVGDSITDSEARTLIMKIRESWF
ncbi:MAG: transcription termination/antitermination protein NusA [Alphaproteobacteria bacterium]|nr:transcription termination/antitermination protein NusA [Alphaproteobacteria bacterium]